MCIEPACSLVNAQQIVLGVRSNVDQETSDAVGNLKLKMVVGGTCSGSKDGEMPKAKIGRKLIKAMCRFHSAKKLGLLIAACSANRLVSPCSFVFNHHFACSLLFGVSSFILHLVN